MAEEGIRALPGQFMGAAGAEANPAAGFVRLALVHDHKSIDEAMRRVARLWHSVQSGVA
jgi:aspartate/methionine/tyrosine aminotransferase